MKENNLNIEQILLDLIIWLKDKNNLWLKDFLHSQNVSYASVLKNSLKNDELRELLQIALEMQESKLLKLAACSKNKSKIAFYMLECLNNSPATFAKDEHKPDPDFKLILVRPKDKNQSGDSNETEEIILNKPKTNSPDTS